MAANKGTIMGKLKIAVKIAVLACAGAGLAACAGDRVSDTGPKEGAGTIAGAVGGALVGSQIGGSTGARVAAGVAGAAIGGLIGNRIGAALDDEDRERAYAAQMQALDTGQPGAPVTWRNPDSGRYGTIVPGPAYQQGGATCRQYTHSIYIDAKPQIARGTACRNPDGSWSPVG